MKQRIGIRWRYSVQAILGVTLLVALGCFWVAWPRRFAERFVVQYFQQTAATANPFREGTPEAKAFVENYKPKARNLTLVAHQRTTLDVLLGRQTFDCEMHEFTVCRGSIVAEPTAYWHSVIRSYR